jgi:hypothetical protein
MNILLDYFFPITTIEPTPAASTAFLKQVLVVGKPKDGGVTTGAITLCTTISQVQAKFGTQASNEVQKLLDAGMSRVFVLPMDDLLLADALEGHESDFFTILISSDFSDADVGTGVTIGAEKASLKIQDVTFTAKNAGTAGNSITINYNSGGTAGAEVVGVVGTAITITMEDGVSTAQDIVDAIEDSVSASALVDVEPDAGDESDKQAVFGAAVPLAGGTDDVTTGIDVGEFKGVVGVQSTDDAFLATQAAIANRAAFHTTSGNKAKNMFYAFGKLLSNALSWRNQQYISMPLADDVDTLGEANSLFDDKVNFVISDDEFSNRLALFAVGGKAIVAPYIKKNLEIDFQSAALSYISGNQPQYTKKQAALLQDELKKVIQDYIDDELITDGTVAVALEEDNFVASANINISEPKALWRIFAEMRQTL